MSGGLYNTIFGVNDLCGLLLELLELDATRIPRFRDCFLYNNTIVVHTRTGGGNREFYDDEVTHRKYHGEYYPEVPFEAYGMYNADLRAHPYFVMEQDDPFDCTYANFFFSFPPEYRTELELLSKNMNNPMPHEKWQTLFKTMGVKTDEQGM